MERLWTACAGSGTRDPHSPLQVTPTCQSLRMSKFKHVKVLSVGCTYASVSFKTQERPPEMSKRAATSPAGSVKRLRTKDAAGTSAPPALDVELAQLIERKRDQAQLDSIEQWASKLDGSTRFCEKCDLSIVWIDKETSIEGKHLFRDGHVVCNSISRTFSLESMYAKFAAHDNLHASDYEVAPVECGCCGVLRIVAINQGEELVI